MEFESNLYAMWRKKHLLTASQVLQRVMGTRQLLSFLPAEAAGEHGARVRRQLSSFHLRESVLLDQDCER